MVLLIFLLFLFLFFYEICFRLLTWTFLVIVSLLELADCYLSGRLCFAVSTLLLLLQQRSYSSNWSSTLAHRLSLALIFAFFLSLMANLSTTRLEDEFRYLLRFILASIFAILSYLNHLHRLLPWFYICADKASDRRNWYLTQLIRANCVLSWNFQRIIIIFRLFLILFWWNRFPIVSIHTFLKLTF